MKRSSAEGASWALLGAMLIGKAGHWFITPIQHPNAPTWKTVLVAAQALVGFGLWGYAAHIQRRARAERAVEHLGPTG